MFKKTGYVTSFGKSIGVICTDSGAFDYPNPVPPCRPAVPCDPNPLPPALTRLQNSTLSSLMEWDVNYYSCVRGSTFSNASLPLLVNGKFPIQCGLLGKYPDPIPWGICEIAQCLTIPAPAGYTTTYAAPISVNVTINYTCVQPGLSTFNSQFNLLNNSGVAIKVKILRLNCNVLNFLAYIPGNSDQPVTVTCQPNGTFNDIVWPVCRAKLGCRASPTPNITTTALMGSTSTGLYEFDYAIFYCKPGASLINITFPGVADGKFNLQCPLGGSFPPTANVSWPSCRVEACTTYIVKSGYTSTAALPVNVNEVCRVILTCYFIF
jgi:hypothetical protein